MKEELTLEFEVPGEVSRGEFVWAVVQVQNRGGAAVDVSSRLNLFEGDLRVRLIGGDHAGKRIHGAYQVDSAPRRASLAPGQALESGVNLFFTSAGLTFSEPGEYRLQLEYDPSVKSPTIVSNEQSVIVHEPSKPADRELAEITLNRDLGRALALAEAEPGSVGRARLERLSTAFPKRREGRIATIVLVAQGDLKGRDKGRSIKVDSDRDALELAYWISGLATPASPRARTLAELFAASVGKGTARGARGRAHAIVSGEPHAISGR
jgi:hypothetical protein